MSNIGLPHSFWARIMPSICVLTAILLGGVGFVVVMRHFATVVREEARYFLPTDRVPTDHEAVVSRVTKYAMTSSEANDVIFIGDSTCLCGIDPTLFEHRTGLRAHNLGAIGFIGIDGDGVVLRLYLQRHPKPRMVVLCVHPTALNTDVNEQWLWLRDRFHDIYGPKVGTRQMGSRSVSLRSISEDSMLGMRGLLTNADEPELSPQNTYANQVMPGSIGVTFNRFQERIEAQKGYWEWPGDLDPDTRSSCGSFPITTKAREDVAEIIRLTNECGIALLIRLTPVLGIEKSCDQADVNTWLHELEVDKNAKVIVSWPGVIEYGPTCFCETRHCSRRGAEDFTAFVAEEVKKSMGDHSTPLQTQDKGHVGLLE
jgi:hypothetical protein